MKTVLPAFVLVLAFTAGAVADTFTVNSTGDNSVCDLSGCTLRGAIEAANANPGPDVIEFFFVIPVGFVVTISPASALPVITEAVTIDGYSVGATENTLPVGDDAQLLIELDGSAAGLFSIGLNIAADNCVIRGLVINRFQNAGININGDNNVVEGNFVGTDADGQVSQSNFFRGISITTGSNNLVGGVSPAARNLISGNVDSGVVIFCCGAQGNLVQGNYIGTNRSGTVVIPNGVDGIIVGSTALSNLIGGADPGAGNLISGNTQNGVTILGDGSGTTGGSNVVAGNLIGLAADGMTILGNGGDGVVIDGSSNNTVGGNVSGAGNVVSANAGSGVRMEGTDNTVLGNFIGTDASGRVGLGNGSNGVLVTRSGNTVGGDLPGAGNVIAANAYGIQVGGLAAATVIQGNWIGTNDFGDPLGNNRSGILINASDTTVGGPAEAGNTIAYNFNAGIFMGSGTGNIILANSIFSNSLLGIDLAGGVEDQNFVTANDFPDDDAGPNSLQNYPVIDQINVEGDSRSVQGSLTSNPDTDYVLNFYSNHDVDPSLHGEGETWLGALDVHTNAQSIAGFSFELPAGALGRFITATATDPAGNTSEFSMASELVPPLSQFLNISTRLRVGTGDNVLIGGFIIDGTEAKEVIVRAIGPSLGNFGVADPLANPILELHYPNGTTVVTNNNWRDDQETEIGATGLAPSDDLESAILVTLDPGAYTAIVRGVNSGTGVALVETYDLSSGLDSALANISTRGLVETGENVMIGGIIVGPDTAPSGSILLRGIGPSLGAFGVPNPLADPMLELRDGNGALVTANDNWRSTQEMAIEGTGLAPGDDLEAAILADLAAGAYTAILSGVGGTTGIGLVEAYHLE